MGAVHEAEHLFTKRMARSTWCSSCSQVGLRFGKRASVTRAKVVDVNASSVSGAFAIVGATVTAADRRFLCRALGWRISTVAEIFSVPTAPGAYEQTELTSFAKDGVAVALNVV